MACQPSYSGLETVYPTVVDDYSSIGTQQLYDIPSGSTVIYNLDDVGMPETLQVSGGALYINGSVAKSFDALVPIPARRSECLIVIRESTCYRLPLIQMEPPCW